MEKKKRIFYLDFIRAIAAVMILLTHYNATYIYMWDETVLSKVVICWRVANLYIGDFGVALFLIVSGAALMKTYEKGLFIKQFYIKRFWNIYPMFWIAYFVAFMHSFWVSRGIDHSIPKLSIIWSVLGMDGYLNSVLPTFYKLGEWFLGFIIIFYIIFPVLRWGVQKHPVLTGIAVWGSYILINCYYTLPVYKSTFLLTRLPELTFGMYYIRYVKKNWWYMAGFGCLVLVMNTVLQPGFDKDIQTTYVGIAAFLLLAWLGDLVQNQRVIVFICKTISKYSFAIFLTHHYIISVITSKFDLYQITRMESYLLFLLCCCVIAFFTRLLFEANRYVTGLVQKK